ncbi:MAG TPA: ABC transporter permease [Acidimicrobiales bacterium]|nr:ABC transporter permease [Acidimicrobiales bacterium]
MKRYFARKILTYVLAFWFGATIDWVIPRLIPGDPVQAYLQRFSVQGAGSPGTWQALYKVYSKAFGLNVPLWDQYWHFWDGLLHGNMGVSLYEFPAPVTRIVWDAAPYTLALLVPAIVLSYVLGNRVGAMAARRKALDDTVLPVAYLFQASPYPWLALALAFYLGEVAHWFPISGGYAEGLVPGANWTFIWSAVQHWVLPFFTVFLVSFGGWAIGMRSLVIYELETDYARYLRSLGASQRLVRRYAYRNAVLPQLSGLALALGTVIGGNIVTEIVFGYPGLGHLIYQAINAQDYFLLQGIFLFIIIGVCLANFVIDIVYVLVDPRTRLSMQGAPA